MKSIQVEILTTNTIPSYSCVVKTWFVLFYTSSFIQAYL